jgi:hypothetical protein
MLISEFTLQIPASLLAVKNMIASFALPDVEHTSTLYTHTHTHTSGKLLLDACATYDYVLIRLHAFAWLLDLVLQARLHFGN